MRAASWRRARAIRDFAALILILSVRAVSGVVRPAMYRSLRVDRSRGEMRLISLSSRPFISAREQTSSGLKRESTSRLDRCVRSPAMCSSRGNNTGRVRSLRRLTSAAFTTMRVSHVENFERPSNERSFVYADNKAHCTASSASSLLRSTENAVRKRRACSRAKTAASASVSPAMALLTITDSSLAGRKSGLETAFLDGCACERSSLRQCRVCGGMASGLCGINRNV